MLCVVGKRTCPRRVKGLGGEVEALYKVSADDVELSSIIKQCTDRIAFMVERGVFELIRRERI